MTQPLFPLPTSAPIATRVVALSLRQPWAWLVLHGKGVENRRWSTKFRGEFLIHAAKGMTRAEYGDAVAFAMLADPASTRGMPSFEAMPRAGIVGKARIVDVLKPCLLACDVDNDVHCRCGHPWHMGDQHGFVLADVTPLPFVPCVGMLGFWTVPEAVLAKIGATK